MSSRRIGFVLGGIVAVGVAAVGVGCTGILGTFEVDPSIGNEAGTEAGTDGLGKACTTATECPTGFCVDGVCCESKCDGVCQACNLAQKGKCLPHAAGTDPENECKAPVRPEAGAPPAEVDAGDAGLPDGSTEGGVVVNLPDNATQSDSECAPKCDGKSACAFPKAEKACGTQWCNEKTTAGRFACDGKGLCEVELKACDAYTCKGDACGKTCAAKEDCLDTHFCNTSGQCQSKLGNGVQCSVSTQCQSGFCVEGVCCNSGCSETPGGTCKSPGKEGQCVCPACPNGTCRLFYRDSDGDGYGDKDGTLPGAVNQGKAIIGCVGSAPPAGYKDKADDCDDGDANAFPGQTQWFSTPSAGKGTFDYSCNTTIEKELREYPGGACRFCGPPRTCAIQNTCSAANTQATLNCELGSYLCGFNPLKFCDGCGRSGLSSNSQGFVTNVACGQSTTYYSCGTCTVVNGGVVGTTTSTRQQRCH